MRKQKKLTNRQKFEQAIENLRMAVEDLREAHASDEDLAPYLESLKTYEEKLARLK